MGWRLLGGKAIGSGVILRIERGDALIVTNRHVVDRNFPSDNDDSAARLARLDRLTVRILGQPDVEGHVIWMAPGRRSTWPWSAYTAPTRRWPRPPPGRRDARCGSGIRSSRSATRTSSAGRTRRASSRSSAAATIDSRRIRVIQTQAAINPGNSGGGLYDKEGYCLGINTWTADKSISEGIGFAIALDTLADLSPPRWPAPRRRPRLPPKPADRRESR